LWACIVSTDCPRFPPALLPLLPEPLLLPEVLELPELPVPLLPPLLVVSLPLLPLPLLLPLEEPWTLVPEDEPPPCPHMVNIAKVKGRYTAPKPLFMGAAVEQQTHRAKPAYLHAGNPSLERVVCK
jgi:hypothetical protein